MTLTVVAAGTVYAINSGILDQFLNQGGKPLINGTILNEDNKTYAIIIIPTNGTVTQPPITPPSEPANKPPVIVVPSSISGDINEEVNIQANVSDPDGNITNIIWNMESEQDVTFQAQNDHLQFTPTEAGKYVFSIEAQDNNGSSTLKSVTANIKGLIPEPVPTPTPIPTPTPTPTPIPAVDRKVIVVGDLESSTAGTAVFNSIKAKNPDVVIALGDLGYSSSLSWFKSTYGKLNMVCVPGNHESANEDGSSALQAETLKYCSNPFYFKLNKILFIGINTNGNLDVQLGEAQAQVMNAKQMQGVKEVHLLTHKPCAVPPNAHHPVETKVKTLCDSLKAKVPAGVKFVNDAAHNHVMSASKDGQYITSGAGGRSHYTCGTNTIFTFCDATHFGYLEYIIKPDGTSSYKFYDYKGSEVK